MNELKTGQYYLYLLLLLLIILQSNNEFKLYIIYNK